MSLRVALAVWLAVMVAANVAIHTWPAWSVANGLVLTAVMAVLARSSGLGAADVGLDRVSRAAGIRWGAVCVGVAAVAYSAALLIPAARDAVAGTAPSWSRTLLAVFVVIPLGTVLPEEFAFRGVLWGLLRRLGSRWTATFVSAGLFGLWHVLPSLGGGSANQAVDDVVGGGTFGQLFRVVGTVLFTGAAGVLFAELRARTGSVLAPMLAHWGVNGCGALFVQLA